MMKRLDWWNRYQSTSGTSSLAKASVSRISGGTRLIVKLKIAPPSMNRKRSRSLAGLRSRKPPPRMIRPS